jgi:hypothetical protein
MRIFPGITVAAETSLGAQTRLLHHVYIIIIIIAQRHNILLSSPNFVKVPVKNVQTDSCSVFVLWMLPTLSCNCNYQYGRFRFPGVPDGI